MFKWKLQLSACIIYQKFQFRESRLDWERTRNNLFQEPSTPRIGRRAGEGGAGRHAPFCSFVVARIWHAVMVGPKSFVFLPQYQKGSVRPECCRPKRCLPRKLFMCLSARIWTAIQFNPIPRLVGSKKVA